MKTKSYFFVAISLLFSIVFFTILSIGIPSCKKLDVSERRNPSMRTDFFDLPENAHPALRKIAAEFGRQNKLTGFVKGMVKNEGMPVWEKSQINESNALNTLGRDGEENEEAVVEVFTPLVLDGEHIVNAFFFSRIIGDSVALHLYRANDFDKYPYGKTDSSIVTAELITVKLLGLNEDIFGHRKFQLKDSNLFNVQNQHSSVSTIEIDTSVVRRTMVECGFVCQYNFTPECISPTNLCTFCELVGCATEYCPITPPYSNPYSWPPDPPVYTSSGGSGGSPSNTPGGGNCTGNNECGTLGSTITEGRIPCGGCGEPPIVVFPPDVPDFLTYLEEVLSLTTSQINTLTQNSSQIRRLFNYLENGSTEQRKEIAREHINQLANSQSYQSFVNGHNSSGDEDLVWWEDDNWLDDPYNFSLDIDNSNQYDKLTDDEKTLVKIYPVQAIHIKENIQPAFNMTESKMGSGGGLNDKKDAFRHAFFQAINTKDVPARLYPIAISASSIVTLFATAHESEVPAVLQLEKQMDLFNNSVGIDYCSNCWLTSDNSIADAILIRLNNGELRYIKPLNFVASPYYDGNNDGIQDCPTCLNGILSSSVLTPTNQ